MGALDDFQRGYREGQSGKYTLVVIAILIVVVLYFIQKWTGIPILDWVKDAGSWVVDKIFDLIRKS